jgi:hypothetical protein|tara:strand:+ start:125 stop:352 length:228 start_codon:yes stop_codon:yes gene_type:complete
MSRSPKDLGLNAIDNILFDRFVAVQYEGAYNMMSQEARESADLSRDEHFTIIKRYSELAEKYPAVVAYYQTHGED